jgi:hypothetical protein
VVLVHSTTGIDVRAIPLTFSLHDPLQPYVWRHIEEDDQFEAGDQNVAPPHQRSRKHPRVPSELRLQEAQTLLDRSLRRERRVGGQPEEVIGVEVCAVDFACERDTQRGCARTGCADDVNACHERGIAMSGRPSQDRWRAYPLTVVSWTGQRGPLSGDDLAGKIDPVWTALPRQGLS